MMYESTQPDTRKKTDTIYLVSFKLEQEFNFQRGQKP